MSGCDFEKPSFTVPMPSSVSNSTWDWIFGAPGQYWDCILQLREYLDSGQSESKQAEALRDTMNILWEQISDQDREKLCQLGVKYLT